MLKNLCGRDYKIIDAEKIPDKKGIVFIKHSSVYELFVGLLLFSPSSWVAKHELMYLPLFRKAIKVFGFIPVKRGLGKSEVSRVIRDGTARLSEGNWIVIFPEGTRKDPREVGRYARSGFELAKKMQVPVLPIVHNSGDCWPAHRFLKFPGKINLTIGAPVENIESSAEAAKKMEDWARKKLELIKLNN